MFSTQVKDYSKLVPVKMDLDSIKSKHRNVRYPTVEALFADVLSVYTNAVMYYEKGGIYKDKFVYEAAKVCRSSLPTLCYHRSGRSCLTFHIMSQYTLYYLCFVLYCFNRTTPASLRLVPHKPQCGMCICTCMTL